MKLYETSLFEAFVWTQAIENQVHDLILHCVDDGRLKLDEKQCATLREFTLGRLIKKLKPCIEDNLYNRLEEITRMRNEVVHRSDYVANMMDWDWELEYKKDIDEEIKRFQQVKIYAGEVYGDLLDLFHYEDAEGKL